MIEKDDLQAAATAGILTEAQAASLISLANNRKYARENLAPGDEPFELFRGFNEIFIVIGLLILTTGWIGVTGLSYVSRITNPQQSAVIIGLIGAAVLWGLSEYFIRYRRMVAPAMTLSILFGLNTVAGLTALFAEPFMIAQNDPSSLLYPFVLANLALLGFWFRFRVPFALALIALGAFLVAILTAASTRGSPDSIADFFLLSAGGPFAWITLVIGVVIFAIAMAFDMSDPHRVTRRSANGFWLHLIAAPALINTIALSLLDRETTGANLALLSVLLLFACVALIIDRRSFLITGIGYIVTLAVIAFDGEGFMTLVLLLGIFLLLLGAFWDKVRAQLLAVMPGFIPLDRLPPAIQRPYE